MQANFYYYGELVKVLELAHAPNKDSSFHLQRVDKRGVTKILKDLMCDEMKFEFDVNSGIETVNIHLIDKEDYIPF